MNWKQVEADDYPSYIANLRALGMPEVTIRRIVTAEIHKEYETRRQELLALEPIPFWEAGFGSKESDLPAYAAIEQEERAELSFLLGTPASSIEITPGDSPISDLKLGGSMVPKAAAILDVEKRIAEARDELTTVGRVLTPADDARLQQLDAEREAALNGLLSAREREEYELRNSPAAQAVRDSLKDRGFTVTEVEFRKLFQAQVEYQRAIAQAARTGQVSIAQDRNRYLRISGQVLGPERTLADTFEEADVSP